MTRGKHYTTVLLILALVTAPFLMISTVMLQCRFELQADFRRMQTGIQVFRRGVRVAPPLALAGDLAPALARTATAPELYAHYRQAMQRTGQRLDDFMATLTAASASGSADMSGLLERVTALQDEWRERHEAPVNPAALAHLQRQLDDALAAILYTTDIAAGVRPRPDQLLSLPLDSLRELGWNLSRLRAIAIQADVASSAMNADLVDIRHRLREQLGDVNARISVLTGRVDDAALERRWQSLRESLQTLMAAPSQPLPWLGLPWPQVLEQSRPVLLAVQALSDRIVVVAEQVVQRAQAESARATAWVVGGLVLLYLVVVVLSLLLYRMTVRAVSNSTEVRAKSQFLARMSHEIRTPLNGVLGLAELLRETEPSPRQQEYIGLIENAGRTLNTLVNDVLDYAKLEAGKLQLDESEFDPAALLIDCARMFSLPASDSGTLILVDVDPVLPACVLGDAPRLRQVLTNLLSNAVKFTRRGWIRVNVRCLKSKEGDETVLLDLHVVDSGIGMSREEQRRLFRHFSQASATVAPRFGGTGLGLSISQELVRLMGGRIRLHSTPGKGSDFHFTIRLPVCQSVVPMQARATNAALLWDCAGNLTELLDGDSRFAPLQRVSTLEEVQAALCEGSVSHLLVNGLTDSVRLDRALLPARERGVDLRPVVLCGMRERGEMIMRDDITLIRRSVLTINELQQLLANSGPLPIPLLSRREPVPDQAGLRVLVAEDNPVNQMVTRGYLQRLGVPDPTLCDDGEQALRAFVAAEGRYRLVLMDLDMPELDGFASARRMREQEAENGWRPAAIFALSAHVMAENDARIVSAGMNGQLIKPLTLSAMQAILHAHLAPNGEHHP